MEVWYPVRLAPRDGTPLILWMEDAEAPPTYPVTVGVWELDDMTERSHWRVFGARYGTHIYFDQHVVGCGRCLALTAPDKKPRNGRLGIAEAFRESVTSALTLQK